MSVCYAALDARAGLVVSLTDEMEFVRAIAKYKPCVPVVIVTTSRVTARSTNGLYGIYPCLGDDEAGVLVSAARANVAAWAEMVSAGAAPLADPRCLGRANFRSCASWDTSSRELDQAAGLACLGGGPG